jgi:hypothetical protein
VLWLERLIKVSNCELHNQVYCWSLQYNIWALANYFWWIDGGQVTGIIPKALAPREVSGETIGDTLIVKDMHERKLMMYKKSDAFIGNIPNLLNSSLMFFL